MSVTLCTSNTADLVEEVKKIEHELASASAPPAAVQRLQGQLAAKRLELDEIIKLEHMAAIEHQRQQEQVALEEIEQQKDQAWSLVQVLRHEMTGLQNRLSRAEFDFNQCLRERAIAIQKLGKGN